MPIILKLMPSRINLSLYCTVSLALYPGGSGEVYIYTVELYHLQTLSSGLEFPHKVHTELMAHEPSLTWDTITVNCYSTVGIIRPTHRTSSSTAGDCTFISIANITKSSIHIH